MDDDSLQQKVAQLEQALHSCRIIGQAQGLIMAKYDVDAEHAFTLLTRLSSVHNVRLRDLASLIAETRKIPEE